MIAMKPISCFRAGIVKLKLQFEYCCVASSLLLMFQDVGTVRKKIGLHSACCEVQRMILFAREKTFKSWPRSRLFPPGTRAGDFPQRREPRNQAIETIARPGSGTSHCGRFA